MEKEKLQTMWLTTGNYNMDNEGWTEVQDGGSPHFSFIGGKQRKNGGAQTMCSLISLEGVIWSRLKNDYVCDVCVRWGQVREAS